MSQFQNNNGPSGNRTTLDRREALLVSNTEGKHKAIQELDADTSGESKSFAKQMKTHRFLVVRAIYFVFHSVWVIVMGIGMFIAWLISLLFI